MMNSNLKAKLTAQAISAYNEQQFGCEKMVFIKAYSVESKKPVTLFEFHHEWGTLVQDREHPNEMVQNLEWNGHREGRSKFVKEFITNAVKSHKVEMSNKKAKRVEREGQKNTIANLFPDLANLKFS